MCDTVFAFGENDSYYLECPSRRCYSSNLPSQIIQDLQNGEVATGYSMALGPNGTFVRTFKRPGPRGTRINSSVDLKVLRDWLLELDTNGEPARNLKELRVSFGATPDRYWAMDGYSYRWGGLPSELAQKVASILNAGGGWKMTPILVAFGFEDEYVLICKSSTTIQLFSNVNNSPELKDVLKFVVEEKLITGVRNISLSPFKRDTFAIQINDMFAVNGLPAGKEALMEDFKQDIKTDSNAKTSAASAANAASAPNDSWSRRTAQQLWDMEHNNSLSLTREVCKNCTRPRGLCDCPVADYQVEYKLP